MSMTERKPKDKKYVKMKNSLFVKYLSISLLVVFISFLILGIMLVFFVAQYSKTEKQNLLTENAVSIANMISNSSTSVNGGVYLGETETLWVRSTISIIANSIDADIFVTDSNGNTKLFADHGNFSDHVVPNDIMAKALSGKYFATTDLGGMYNNDHYVVAIPIVSDTGNSNATVGVVFVSTPAESFSDVTQEIARIFLLAAITTFFIVFCIIGVYTYNMVSPLQHMSKAANSLAKGDFSVRVPVTSNDEIGQLSQAFNHMADSLAVSESTRRSFIANVSHELKTPMTTIAGFIDGILDGTIPPEKQKHYLGIVSVEVCRLSRLVASMLSLSRIDNGELKMNKQRFDLTDIVISTLLTFEQKIDMRQIEIRGLENCEPTPVAGDPDLIHQVVYNIIENAVKFVNQGGYIEIVINNMPDRISLSIKNSGAGIEPEELMHIFERFYKTDKSRSQDKNGMGLGLYIVKTIMRLHGGDITADSVVNNYCTFSLWLPKDSSSKQRKIKDNIPVTDKSNISPLDVACSKVIETTAEEIEQIPIDNAHKESERHE